ncbi:MAG: Cupin domain [Pseudomonadota bacterium]|jgi:quercetin dioxygenase-like cupin family protein/DNA-binding XRE family transcriptional regulator
MNDNRAMPARLSSPADPFVDELDPDGRAAQRREAIGRRLRRARQTAGLTLAALAQRSGVPLSTVSKIELGRHAASHEKLVALACALGPGLPLLWPTGADAAAAMAPQGGVATASGREALPGTSTGIVAVPGGSSAVASMADRSTRPPPAPDVRTATAPAGPRAVRSRLEDAPRLRAPPVALASADSGGGSSGDDGAQPAPAAAGLWRELAAGFGGAVMRPFHQVVLARGTDGDPGPIGPWQHHDGQCLLHVLGGAVLLSLDDGARWPLAQGQSVYLAAGVGHRCWSTSARPAELLWVLGPEA